MKNKTEKRIKLISLNLVVILIAGIIVGWVYLNFPEVIEKWGIPFAPQFVIIVIVFFLLGLICYKSKKTSERVI